MTSARAPREQRSIGILGGGFGLYGYLPAAVQHGARVILLPERTRARFALRPELQRFSSTIRWLPEETILQQAEMLIVARRPIDNAEIVAAWAGAQNKSTARELVLEKPLSVTPADARNLLEAVVQHRVDLKTGFTFRWTTWGRHWLALLQARTAAASRSTWHVRWFFLAHHYAHGLSNWKRFHAMGGGALRFFGIHLIALLAEAGCNEVIDSTLIHQPDGDAPRWRATLRGPHHQEVTVDVDACSSSTTFEVRRDDGMIVHDGRDPFDPPLPQMPWSDVDRRCGLLTELLDEQALVGDQRATRIATATNLWDKVEEATRLVSATRR